MHLALNVLMPIREPGLTGGILIERKCLVDVLLDAAGVVVVVQPAMWVYHTHSISDFTQVLSYNQ